MNVGLSDRIRSLARAKYVGPAIRAGKNKFSIRVRDVWNDLHAEGGFPGGHTPQICSALQTSKFLRENGLEIESIDGPPSKQSPTVVFHYRRSDTDTGPKSVIFSSPVMGTQGDDDDPSARAKRLTEKLRGLLKNELAEYGGGEAFLRWVRGYEEEDAE
jgi:hypothetical protein